MKRHSLSKKAGSIDSTAAEKIRAKNRALLVQDMGLLAFLLGIVAAGMLVSFSTSESLRMESMIMFLVMSGAVVLSAYQFRYLSIVLCMVQVCFYAAYRIYMAFVEGQSIELICYGWLIIPLLTVGAMTVFMQGTYRINAVAELLDKQLTEMVMTDKGTGLYNLKSMYLDIERQIALCKRNGLKLSLIIMELRDREELKNILNSAEFDTLRIALAEAVEDCIRIEDRLYALDEEGKMGILCTGDGKDAEIVKRRILSAMKKSDTFQKVLGRALRIELRMGIYEYNEETVENSVDLKRKAENEMQYDV